MLLQSVIYQNRGTIHEPKSNITYRFDKCLAVARSDLGILTEDAVINLTILYGYRDCAMHHLLYMSEECLYINAQSAVSIFDEILQKSFDERLADHLPSRILPISTNPPTEMNLFIDSEFTQIHKLIAPNRRKRSEARARLRPFLIMESVLSGQINQPTNIQISKIIDKLIKGQSWQSIFPGVTTLRLDTSGHGLTYSARFTREAEAPPVRIVRENDQVEGPTLVREINLLDRYSMGRYDIADKLGIGKNKALALMYYLRIQEDPDCFHEFRHKSMRFKGYSLVALNKMKEALSSLDLDKIYQDYRQQQLNKLS